jgi:hypothetical protein
MKSDWIWGAAALVPSALLAALLLDAMGIDDVLTGMIGPLTFMLFMMIPPVTIAWLANQHSIRKLRSAGGEIELVVRPFAALARSVVVFPAIFGAYVLVQLAFGHAPQDWGRLIILAAVPSYCVALSNTAYKKAD